MRDLKAIRAWRQRRKDRLDARGWEEEKHPRDGSGKFTSGGASGAGSEASTEKPKAPKTCRVKANKFLSALSSARSSCDESIRWRVTAYGNADELAEEHEDAKLYTKGKSSYGVDNTGNIFGVCKHAQDKDISGRELIREAVKHGGKKLDSFAGNHGFYERCGFQAVSWCEFDEKYAPEGWDKTRDDYEPVVFYKYVGEGNVKHVGMDEIKTKVKKYEDYGSAMEARDAEVK